jgi:hypothetical protein
MNRGERTVNVWNEPQIVLVYQKSKSVWIAVAQYLGETIEMKGRSASQAVRNWRAAARYRGK